MKTNKLTIVISKKSIFTLVFIKEYPKISIMDISEEIALQKMLLLIEKIKKLYH
jgi:hypothetical protein